jgi:hypothetical protein
LGWQAWIPAEYQFWLAIGLYGLSGSLVVWVVLGWVAKNVARQDEIDTELRTAYEHLRDPKKRAMVDLFLLQPPPPMPNRRRPKYDLSVHQEDLIALAVDILSMPMEEDFQGA